MPTLIEVLSAIAGVFSCGYVFKRLYHGGDWRDVVTGVLLMILGVLLRILQAVENG